MRRVLALLAGTLLVATAGARVAGAAEGSFGIRLLDVPAERADDPRAQSYVIDHLSPGDGIERRVEVSNSSDGPVTVALYAASASVEGGRFLFGEDRARNELTGWTRVTPSSLTLSSGEKATATVTVAVPTGATAGEHYGVIWAEARADAPEGGVSTAHRVGVRMYLSIGAGGEPPSDFEIRSFRAARDEDGQPLVEADVENTGRRALDLTGRLELDRGPGGLAAGPYDMEVGTTLAPGETAAATVLLDPSLPNGPWHAVIIVRSGNLERRAEATIAFPAEHARSAPPVAVGRSGGAEGQGPLQMALAMATGLLAAGGFLIMLVAHRRRQSAGGEDGPVSAARRPPGPRPEPGRGDPPRQRRRGSRRESHPPPVERGPVAREHRPRVPPRRGSSLPRRRPPRAPRAAPAR